MKTQFEIIIKAMKIPKLKAALMCKWANIQIVLIIFC